jgi:predicted transcriptional regulator
MAREIGSLLKEIQAFRPYQDVPNELDIQGRHVFAAVRRLITRIEKECEEEVAADLVKRLLNAIKTDDYKKYERGIRRLKEGGKDDTETEITTEAQKKPE